MIKWILTLCLNLMVLGLFSQTYSIAGEVLDIESREPIVGCNIYLSHSTKGTFSDQQGRFELKEISSSKIYELVFSHVAYETKVYKISDNETKVFNVQLVPLKTKLDDIVVNSKVDRKWKRQLKQFKREFLGTGYKDSQIKIINDYEINFDNSKKGMLKLDKSVILNIENYFLGYTIHYALKEFIYENGIHRYTGQPQFSKMEAENEYEFLKWRKNRKAAFEGSRTHFFKSLLARQLDAKKFKAYYTTYDPLVYDSESNEDLFFKKKKLILDTNKEEPQNVIIVETARKGIFKVVLDQTVEVEFNGNNSLSKTSYIRMMYDFILVDKDGYLEDAYSCMFLGPMGMRGVYNELPRDYVYGN